MSWLLEKLQQETGLLLNSLHHLCWHSLRIFFFAEAHRFHTSSIATPSAHLLYSLFLSDTSSIATASIYLFCSLFLSGAFSNIQANPIASSRWTCRTEGYDPYKSDPVSRRMESVTRVWTLVDMMAHHLHCQACLAAFCKRVGQDRERYFANSLINLMQWGSHLPNVSTPRHNNFASEELKNKT